MAHFSKSKWLLATLIAAAFSAAIIPATRAAETTTKEADEVKIPVDQLPAAVKATLTKEAGSATVKEAEKETEDGKTTYEADATIDGKAYEIKVAEDGSLISKKLNDDADEKADGDKKEKEDKDDKKEEHGEH